MWAGMNIINMTQQISHGCLQVEMNLVVIDYNEETTIWRGTLPLLQEKWDTFSQNAWIIFK